MTLRELLLSSMRLIGVGDAVTNDELNDAISALNLMLQGWATPPHNLTVQALTHETKTLTAGTATYTIGVGGDINSARPTDIQHAFIRDASNYDWPLDKIGVIEYQQEPDKTTQARPEKFAYEPVHSLGKIYLHPTPNAAETLCIDSIKPLADLAYSGLGTTLTLPGETLVAVKFNLAIELAPEFGAQPSQVVIVRAQETLQSLKDATAVTRLRQISPEFSSRKTWDFFSGA